MTVPVVFAIAGVIALLLGALGGGIKAKEIEIPPAPPRARILITVAGFIFIGISIWLSTPTSTSSQVALTETPSPTATIASINTPVIIDTATPDISKISNEELFNLASTQWQKIASDDFSDNQNDWWIEDYTTSSGDYYDATINGKYQIDFKTTDGTSDRFTSDIITIPQNDFFLKVDVRRSQQPSCSAGIIWETSTGYYAFVINDVDSEFKLFSHEYNTDEYPDIIGWRDSKYILKDEINRLIVIHLGELYKLYINDQFVGEETGKYRNNGNVGFYTQVCADNAQVTFEFDNLEIRTP